MLSQCNKHLNQRHSRVDNSQHTLKDIDITISGQTCLDMYVNIHMIYKFPRELQFYYVHICDGQILYGQSGGCDVIGCRH